MDQKDLYEEALLDYTITLNTLKIVVQVEYML